MSHWAWLSSLAWTAAGFLALRTCKFLYAWWHRSRSPLRVLKGPRENAGWFAGNQPQIFSGENMRVHEDWAAQHGGTFVLRLLLGRHQLVTTDARALTHILFANHVYHKATVQRRGLKRLVGEGLIWSEGEKLSGTVFEISEASPTETHNTEIRLINPAFSHVHVREMTGIFLEKAAKLCEIWHNGCVEAGGTARFDALEWISKATLDAIGKAGFDYDFNILNGEQNELADAFSRILRVDVTPRAQLWTFFSVQFPILRVFFPDKRLKDFDDSKRVMEMIGMRMVQEKKELILGNINSGSALEKNAFGGKDLLSLLLQANLARDLDPAQRISDAEVLAQIPTFIFAGHETTSNVTTWALYELAVHPEVQDKLRAELQECGSDDPTLETLNAMPYLDQVVRETLRFHPTLTFLTREAVCDDVVPLDTPVPDRYGGSASHIRIQQGDNVMVPVWLVNRSKDVWGPDADQFRPERWATDIRARAKALPGIAPGLLSFNGGPRSCVGHRFAVAEMKALLFHIVRRFEVRLAVHPSQIWSRTSPVRRPQLRGDNSVQLPVVLKPVQ